MTIHSIARICAGAGIMGVLSLVGFGQERPDEAIGGPLGYTPVINAPFSAEATTTVHLIRADGTRLEQETTARYYRDAAGRARVELMMDGLPAPKTISERYIRTIIAPMAPDDRRVLMLDSETRRVRGFVPIWAAQAFGGWNRSFAVPIGGVRFFVMRPAQALLGDGFPQPLISAVNDEALGSHSLEGVETTGRRVTLTLAPRSRNDLPSELVDERWECADLKLLVSAHFSDSRFGVVDYQLTNVRRTAPPPELFVVPLDYTIDESGDHLDPAWATTSAETYLTKGWPDSRGGTVRAGSADRSREW